MEPRFSCTACGKCCHGWLPLTLKDAVAHAGRFPLAMVWTPVRSNAKFYDLATRLGQTVRLPNRKTVAVLVQPTAYLPPSYPCPELRADNLCGIHADKPSRCRTMPFYPYREEKDQADLLIPRKGWQCDVSAAAPVVYSNHAILDRADFDRERGELLDQAPVMRAYVDYILKYMPWTLDELAKLAAKPTEEVFCGERLSDSPPPEGIKITPYAATTLPPLGKSPPAPHTPYYLSTLPRRTPWEPKRIHSQTPFCRSRRTGAHPPHNR